MANRGFFQRRGDTTDLVGRIGQSTSGLPTGNQENAVLNNLRVGGHDGSAFTVPVVGLILLPASDDLADRSSYQINQPFGFFGTNQPRSFSIVGGTTTYYKMRGYYVAGSVYETYVVVGSPSATPPSGHALIEVAIVATWQA